MDPALKRLAEIDGLAERATAPPWTVKRPFPGQTKCFDTDDTWIEAPEPGSKDRNAYGSIAAIRRGCEEMGQDKENQTDAALIVTLRNSWPALRDVIRAAIEMRERLDGDRDSAVELVRLVIAAGHFDTALAALGEG